MESPKVGISERISARAKEIGIRQVDVAKHTDATKATVSRWFNFDVEPDAKFLWKLCDLLRCSPDWLLYGKGRPEDNPVSVVAVPIGHTRVPVISYVQAGLMTETCDRCLPDGSTEYIQTDIDLGKMAFALEVKGDSMKPDILDGDVVIVDPDVQPVPGDYVVAKNGSHEATIKRYRPRGTNEAGEEYFELVPANPDYPSIRSDHSQVMIIGVVMERRVRRRNK